MSVWRMMRDSLKRFLWSRAERGRPHLPVEHDPKLHAMERQSEALRQRVDDMERMLQVERDYRAWQNRDF